MNRNVSERKKHTRGEIAVMICLALATCVGLTLLVEHVIGTHAWAGERTEEYTINETVIINSDGSICYYNEVTAKYTPQKDNHGVIQSWVRTVVKVLKEWFSSCASLDGSPGADDGVKIAKASSMTGPSTSADFYIPLAGAA